MVRLHARIRMALAVAPVPAVLFFFLPVRFFLPFFFGAGGCSTDRSSTSAISFLLRLTFQQPGRAYAMTDVWSDMEQAVVRDLTHLGVLYMFEDKKNDLLRLTDL